MENIVAVNTNTYHGFGVDETLEGIAAAGFKYVELCAVRGWTEHIMPDFPDEELDRIAAKLKELGLTCVAVGGHCNLTDAARLNDFRANMKLAHRFGAKWIISSTGEAHFGEGECLTDDVLIRNIRELVPDLEKYDLRLGIEIHGEYDTGEKILALVNGVGSDRVGINYDTANVMFYGGKKPEEEVKTCVEAVNFVHLKDKVGFDNHWDFPAIGKGDLDLLGFIRYVREHGYGGPFSIEIEHNAEFTMREKRPGEIEFVNDIVRQSWEYLKEHGIV